MRHYVTYCDIGYAARALVLAESLHRHETHPYELVVVCFDELTRLVVEELAPGNISTVPLHKVEERFPELHRCRAERTRQEYCWTLSAPCLYYVLESRPDIDTMIYSDADCAFFSNPQPVFDEIGDASVMIHEHRFQQCMYRHEDPNNYGKYNVGLMLFRRDDIGLDVLKWWTERNIEWCKAVPEDGKFGDQKYLDDWPERFENIHVLQTPVAGTAPWNHQNYSFSTDGEQPRVEGEPLVHYHFHALKFWEEDAIVPLNVDYSLNEDCLEAVYKRYMVSLMSWRTTLHQAFPSIELSQTAGGAPKETNTDLIQTWDGAQWSQSSIRHEALRAPRSIEHLVGSFENAAVTLHKEPTSENAQIFYELRAKFATFLLQSQPDGPSAEVFGQRMRRIMPIIWRLDSDLDPNTRMVNRQVVRGFQRSRRINDAAILVAALYDGFSQWSMLMREALFANPWPIWLFALMNTDHEGLVSKLGESEASHYREQILLKLREHQGTSSGERLSM